MYPHWPLSALKSLAVCLIALLCLLSCGLETLYYIDNIQQSDYRDETEATVQLPWSSQEGYGSPNDYFNNFIIFYRIYLSDSLSGKGAFYPNQLNLINDNLTSDFNRFYPLTVTTSGSTVTTSGLDNTFFLRYYCKLELEGARIDTILGDNSLGKILRISFYQEQGRSPTLILDGTSYVLRRANISGIIPFNPRPDNSRSFLNYPDLYNVANAKTEINADASPHPGDDVRFTFVSMYIAAVGQSGESPPATIFSQPTFIGIFRLPDP